MTRVTARIHKAATVEEHPGRLANRRRSPATTQMSDTIPERLRLVACILSILCRGQWSMVNGQWFHELVACIRLVPIPHGKLRRGETELGVDVL